ncbi:hypothetical protein DL96DRAFT_1822509 [Flagelloscypha sp. PMI_526]|nr:hypothetical protein DL96DRAFT_1822509 [Flagelloscypha sp. PMI_526]
MSASTNKLKKMLHVARTSLQGLQELCETWTTHVDQFLDLGILDFFFNILSSEPIPWDICLDDIPVPYTGNNGSDAVAKRAQVAFCCLDRLAQIYNHGNQLPSQFHSSIMKGWPSLLCWSIFFINLKGLPKTKFLKISSLVGSTWAALIACDLAYFSHAVNDVPGAFELYSRVWVSAIDNPDERGDVTGIFYDLCRTRLLKGYDPVLDFFHASASTPSLAASTMLEKLLVPQDIQYPGLLLMKVAILVLFSELSAEFNDAVVRHGVVLKSVEFLRVFTNRAVFPQPSQSGWILAPLFTRITDWIHAGDGTTWMKRALRAGLTGKIVLSVQSCGQGPYLQDYFPVAENLLSYSILYSTHPHITPLLTNEGWREATLQSNWLPSPAVKSAFMQICVSLVQLNWRAEAIDKFAQQIVGCGNDNCELQNVRLSSYSRCYGIQYCSRLCQRRHWKIHRHFCREYTTKTTTQALSHTLIRNDRLNQCHTALDFLKKSPDIAQAMQEGKLVLDAGEAVILVNGEDQLSQPVFKIVPFRSSGLARAYGIAGSPTDAKLRRSSVFYDQSILEDSTRRRVHVDLSYSRDGGKYAMRIHTVVGVRLIQ